MFAIPSVIITVPCSICLQSAVVGILSGINNSPFYSLASDLDGIILCMLSQVAQVAAYELGIPLNTINFLPSNTHSNANSSITGGSLGSDVCSYVSVPQSCVRAPGWGDNETVYQVAGGIK